MPVPVALGASNGASWFKMFQMVAWIAIVLLSLYPGSVSYCCVSHAAWRYRSRLLNRVAPRLPLLRIDLLAHQSSFRLTSWKKSTQFSTTVLLFDESRTPV